MKLLKNLLGNNSKIDIDEIARVVNEEVELLGDLVDWEIGSNSNGTYLKHPGGVAICLFKGLPDATTNSVASLYRGDVKNWYYPIDFVSVPFFKASVDNANRWETSRPLIDRGQVVQWATYSNGSMIDVYCLAIGLWK